MSLKPKAPPLSLLLLLVSFGSVGAVLFTPALPMIQSFFLLSESSAQLTISIYLIGYAVGQLPYGPLANAIGRKKTLFLGLIIAAIGSILCALSYYTHMFSLLLFGRLIQALGSCVGIKISFTMIADTCDRVSSAKKISQLLIAFAVMPGIAVAVGGWLTQYFGWQSCFYFLALFSFLVISLSLSLHETGTEIHKSYLKIPNIIKGYKEKIQNRQLVLSGLIMGCGTAVVYMFGAKAPFIAMNKIGLSPKAFGNLSLIPSIGMIIGSFLSIYMIGKIPIRKMMKLGIFGAISSALVMMILFSYQVINIYTLFVPISFIYVFESLIYTNTSSLGLSSAQNKSYGSAMINFITLALALCFVFMIEFIYPEIPLLLPLSFVVVLFLIFIFWLKLKKKVLLDK